MMRTRSVPAAALVASLVSGLPCAAAADDSCPEHSAAVSESGDVVHCKCVAGYENREGACLAVSPPMMTSNTEAKRIARLCKELGNERDVMRGISLKLVQLNLDAIGKLMRVRIAVWEGAEEPPEDVLREAREHLGRIAEIGEQIDEMNGKARWTAQERQWVLGHVYVATPNGDFAVNESTSTPRGQTAFSDLRRMPEFEGCRISDTGRRYIPQY